MDNRWLAAAVQLLSDAKTVDGSSLTYNLGRGQFAKSFFHGYFRRLVVWNTRLSDTALQALTAP